ncbi:MAG: aspartate-semialdehyde dehydrogenase [Gemmatimonadetes bacterium]|nr:aspartate-semialdehyde dehydrogenase [Gemmatimonadota bacterium]
MKVAILGATGAVGRTMLRVLEERRFPVDELVLLASERSEGSRIAWGGRSWEVRAPTQGAFRGCDVALFSAGAARSREWAPVAAAEGAVVVDNSSAWRMDPDVPLVVPEVNPEAARRRPKGIIANPNCATIQFVVPLEGLRRRAGIRRIVATTFQSVSGAGQKGLDALAAELAGGSSADSPFPGPIAGNAIPWIGPRGPDGWNEEEDKLRNETRKIMGLEGVPIAATCVRVPVEVGHAVSGTVELEEELSADEARAAMAEVSGVEVWTDDRDPLPRDVAGLDVVRVGHVRVDRDLPRVLHFWVVADNLRKGAATNAVQIAEMLLRA